jgi:uncharacterized protein YcbK (DUF882 family)
MSRATAFAIAVVSVLAVASDQAGAAPTAPVKHARLVDKGPPRTFVPAATRMSLSWAASLEPVDVRMRNTGAQAKIRLYADDGSIDPAAARAFMRVAASAKGNDEPHPVRLVQLVFRAAYHFGNKRVVIVSATRKGAHGKHGIGEAIDFQLEGVRASSLASYLRGVPRAGVGIYPHPKTQYVHLDVRDRSFHWIDGSPPGVTWRERGLRDPNQPKRDASYGPIMDLPESAASGSAPVPAAAQKARARKARRGAQAVR